ncbi:BAG family molecular chaperone regulator 2-like [Rutidosis leptorrhynchoides]|uniref:BAG family molecular chaperone regulator 2-like n=1 Tax=Rutidosis leptorrhynchoides TaxID=125765 RepID=UPI003A99C78A
MMRMRTKTTELTSIKGVKDGELEVRPGGMLVQKRDPDHPQNRIPPPTIRVRVKHGSVYHEIIIKATATFGELKKMLSGPTGLHHEDQKVIHKDKERASKTFLDVVGVKDKSKMVVIEDLISQEKRLLEARKNAKLEKIVKLVSEIGHEVDRLADQVVAVESIISKGGKVAEKMISNLIELLMNQLLKLDEIKIDGDVNLQKQKQVEKVRKYVETLDVLKVKNTTTNHVSKPTQSHTNGLGGAASQPPHNNHHHQQFRRSVEKFSPTPHQQQSQRGELSKNISGGVVVTTQWETFDSLPTIFPTPQSTSTSTTSETTIHSNFNWDLLLK